MGVKETARQQYRRIVDPVVRQAFPGVPQEGWIRTLRKAFGMSGPQLALRMGVTRARVAQAEQAELSGAATIKSMQAAAEALDCRFVYAIVPNSSVDDIVAGQARRKAEGLVRIASTHMALENQMLSSDRIDEEVARLSRELVHEMPSDFWSDG